MDIRKIKKLIEILEETSIAEIEIHEGEESLRISRVSATTQIITPAEAPPPPSQPQAPSEETAPVA